MCVLFFKDRETKRVRDFNASHLISSQKLCFVKIELTQSKGSNKIVYVSYLILSYGNSDILSHAETTFDTRRPFHASLNINLPLFSSGSSSLLL